MGHDVLKFPLFELLIMFCHAIVKFPSLLRIVGTIYFTATEY